MKRPYSTEEYLEKAKKIHGDEYDYSQVKYSNSHEKIKIVCRIHGPFMQTGNSHLNGNGCPECGRIKTIDSKRLTTKTFIEKATIVHNNEYDYSNLVYKTSYEKVEIICSIHGSFWQTANDHLNGYRCNECYGLKKLTTEQFIEKANQVHNFIYSYNRAEYIGANSKIEVVCLKHGSFYPVAYNHLHGTGCPSCYGNTQLTTEQFIKKAQEIHGNKYLYDKVAYVNNSTKIEIICLKHGSFWQVPVEHTSGKGCCRCSNNSSKPENIWLDELNILKEYRQFEIKINDRRFNVDGYEPQTNTIYEFLGDYWHGNPEIYKPDGLNKRIKKTFGELYQKTMEKICFLQQNGFTVNFIWENDWKKSKSFKKAGGIK